MSASQGVVNIKRLSNGADIVIVCDDRQLCEYLRGEGYPVLRWTPDLVMPDDSTVLLSLCHQDSNPTIRKQFLNAAVLVVPLASFDNDHPPFQYTMDLVLATDYSDTCRRNRDWIQELTDSSDGVFEFTGPSTELTCRIRDDIEVSTSTEVVIEPGQWVSVGSYCEVSMVAPSRDDWRGAFTIDGYAQAVGLLAGVDPRATTAGRERARSAQPLRQELASKAPIRLELRDGVLQSVLVDGKERSSDVSRVTNPDYGLQTFELGLGTNPGIADLIDWTVNSQLNEGVGQIHLGFGEGITGAHLDFLIEEVKIK